ncbi:hypothetical protein ACRAWF_14395 [Streptomyces sp. L7]
MNTDPQELAELLPAPGRPVLSRDRHRVLREHLMQHITHEHDTVREQSTTTATAPGRPARRRLVLAAAPLALAAAVGLGVVAVDNARDAKDGTAAADGHQKAVQLLDRIALAAADRTAVTARADQFIYTKSQGSAAELGVQFNSAAELSRHKGLFTPKPYNGAVLQEQWDAVDGKADGLRKGVAVADPTQEMSMDIEGHRIPDLPSAPGPAHRPRRPAEEVRRRCHERIGGPPYGSCRGEPRCRRRRGHPAARPQRRDLPCPGRAPGR